MKKLVFSLLVLVLMTSFSSAEKKILKISTDPWPPWIIGQDKQEPEGGFAFKVVQELAKRLGVQTETTIYPFARALDNAYKGKADMILMVSKTPEREEKLIYTDMIIDDPYLMFYDASRMGDFMWEGFEAFKDFKIGVVRAFNYGDGWNEAVNRYQIKTDEVTNDETNLKKLYAARVDFAIIGKTNAQYMINNNDKWKGRIKFCPKAVRMTSFAFAVSKKSPFAEQMPQINKIISDMRTDGTIEKILNEKP